METNFFEYENKYRAQGYKLIAGVDEAGRGPLAGAVYAAAVVFDEGVYIEGVNDSKKLSAKKIEKLFDEIIAKAQAVSTRREVQQIVDNIPGMISH